MNQRGLSYLELLVVIAIIGVMAAFSVPTFSPTSQRLASLEKDYRLFLGLLDQARFGATQGHTSWVMVLPCNDPNNPTPTTGDIIQLGPDDGWRGVSGPGSWRMRTSMYRKFESEEYDSNDPNYDPNDPSNYDPNDPNQLFDPWEAGNNSLTQSESMAPSNHPYRFSTFVGLVPEVNNGTDATTCPRTLVFKRGGNIVDTSNIPINVTVFILGDLKLLNEYAIDYDPLDPGTLTAQILPFVKPIVLLPTGVVVSPYE